MTRPELVIEGNSYAGWTNLTLARSVDQVEHSLQASTVDQWAGEGITIPIEEGQDVEVRFGREVLMAGFVDEVSPSFDGESHQVAIVAYSHSADLVDSSAIDGGPWKDAKIDQIASDLVSKFTAGVTVDSTLVGAPLKRFRAERDEAVIDALRRMAMQRGLLLYTDPSGGLVFGKASTDRVSFKIQAGRAGGRTPTNVLTGTRSGGSRNRFSEYVVTSQNSNRDNFSGTQASGALYRATDDQITRHRPMVVRANTQEATLTARGDWERNVRHGRSKRYVYTLQGWEYEDGKTWAPNLLVGVDDGLLDVADELLIVTATLSVGDEGLITSLELAPPTAFDALPPKELKKKRRKATLADFARIFGAGSALQ